VALLGTRETFDHWSPPARCPTLRSAKFDEHAVPPRDFPAEVRNEQLRLLYRVPAALQAAGPDAPARRAHGGAATAADRSGALIRSRTRSSARAGTGLATNANVSTARLGILLVASASACWSSGGLLVRMVGTDPWTTTAWRCVFSAAFLILVVRLTGGGNVVAQWRGIGWPGFAVAVCLALASTSFILALARTSVANTLILISIGPYVAGLLGWLMLDERVRVRTWVTMVAALAGAVVMVSGSWAAGRIVGDLFAVLMAGAFATGTVIVRRHPDIQMTPAASLAAALAFLLALPLSSPMSASALDLGLLALFGAQFGIGFLLFTRGARLIPVAQTALIGMLETVLGPFWVWLALGETPGVATLTGGAVILAAVGTHAVLDLKQK
jgi:drug/metabolite transporter (DMT)-like permease